MALRFSNPLTVRRSRSPTPLNVGIRRASNVVTERYEGLCAQVVAAVAPRIARTRPDLFFRRPVVSARSRNVTLGQSVGLTGWRSGAAGLFGRWHDPTPEVGRWSLPARPLPVSHPAWVGPRFCGTRRQCWRCTGWCGLHPQRAARVARRFIHPDCPGRRVAAGLALSFKSVRIRKFRIDLVPSRLFHSES
jgi:hypothetical protein